MSAERERRLLIAGLGNVLLRDDGFGSVVAERLARRVAGPQVTVATYGIAGVALVQDLVAGYAGLVLIDVVVRGGPPGRLYWLRPVVPAPGEGEARFLAEPHAVGVSRALVLARALGVLPDYVRILGCQPAAADDLGIGLTPAVAAAADRAVQALADWVPRWLEDPAAEPALRAAPVGCQGG